MGVYGSGVKYYILFLQIPLWVSNFMIMIIASTGILCLLLFISRDLGFPISGTFISAIRHVPGCFCPLTFLVHVTIGPLYATFVFSTRMFYRGVRGFVTDSSSRVWCRWLTTCPLYFGPHFRNLVLNDIWFVSLTWRILHFHCYISVLAYEFTYVLIPHEIICLSYLMPNVFQLL